jgi:hypothetical protein
VRREVDVAPDPPHAASSSAMTAAAANLLPTSRLIDSLTPGTPERFPPGNRKGARGVAAQVVAVR